MAKYNIISKKAFSLTEISVVIIAIGIITVSILKGQALLYDSKIKSAQNLTINSPVNNIYNLGFWLETSMPESFIDGENNNKTNITLWQDINPQSPVKYHGYAGQNSSATNFYYTTNSDTVSGPQYIKKGINNLPTLRFDNSGSKNQYIVLDPKIRNQRGRSFTFFIVMKYNSGSGYFLDRSTINLNDVATTPSSSVSNGNPLFSGFISSSKDIQIFFRSQNGLQTSGAFSIGYFIKNSESFIITLQRNYNNNINTYINGAKSQNNISENYGPINLDPFKIGAHANDSEDLNIDISEVIFYNDQISHIDQQSIEQYLSQKYNIKLTAFSE